MFKTIAVGGGVGESRSQNIERSEKERRHVVVIEIYKKLVPAKF
jgi:hypothetical protein